MKIYLKVLDYGKNVFGIFLDDKVIEIRGKLTKGEFEKIIKPPDKNVELLINRSSVQHYRDEKSGV